VGTRPKLEWTRNRVLAAIALALGVLAIPGNPYRGHAVRLDTQELATIVGGKVDHVSATELADWIVQNRTDYRLVDVRDPAEFDAWHIPTAENVPIAALPDAGLGRNEKIVLVSEGGIHSAQAWFLLKAQGYAGAYILFGGLEAWKDEVLYPVAPSNPTREQASAFERAAHVARFFGGSPRAAGSDSATAALLLPPPVAPASGAAVTPGRAPTPPAGAKPAPVRKKKKEGC
jgi:rhodanese-related sulfurtransferase